MNFVVEYNDIYGSWFRWLENWNVNDVIRVYGPKGLIRIYNEKGEVIFENKETK